LRGPRLIFRRWGYSGILKILKEKKRYLITVGKFL
jgi:hypothetical protein